MTYAIHVEGIWCAERLRYGKWRFLFDDGMAGCSGIRWNVFQLSLLLLLLLLEDFLLFLKFS